MVTVFLERTCEDEERTYSFDFDLQETAVLAAEAVLRRLGCPWDAEVNLILTDAAGIREVNRSTRGIDLVTDVLSFPVVGYDPPASWESAEADRAGSFNPENDALLLGDIMICEDRIREQARQYGHSELREFAFLEVHSLLHLLGYDHMKKEEEREMFALQEEILEGVGITRNMT